MNVFLENFHTIAFDFDGVFTDNFVYVDENGTESVRVSRGDGYAIDLLKKFKLRHSLNIDFFIISTERNRVVRARAAKLELECIWGESNKLQTIKRKYEKERPLDLNPLAGLIYFGNDLNDLPVILEAGMSFAPKDAHPRVKEASTHILSATGGHGFVRQGVELLMGIYAMNEEELNDYISNS